MHEEVALYVPPSPDSHQPMMVGRFYHLVLEHIHWCFFHETSETERGLSLADDKHGGVDAATVQFLIEQRCDGWVMFHHAYDQPALQHVVLFSTFLEHAEFVPDIDGRYRLFLPAEYWISLTQRVPERHLPRLDLPIVTRDPRQSFSLSSF